MRSFGLIRCLVALALAAPSLAGAFGANAQAVIVELDERDGASSDPRLKIVRMQSNMERIAAGQPIWPLAEGQQHDPLEAIVDAYGLFLTGDTAGMDAALAKIAERVPAAAQKAAIGYFKHLELLAADKSVLVRLLAGLRRVDGALFLAAAGFAEADIEKRTVSRSMATAPSPLNGTWLRLPCRTAMGRAPDFAAAAAAFGKSRGPFLSCPAENADFQRLEALARDPAALQPKAPKPVTASAQAPAAEPAVPPQPWDRAAAVAHMADDPDLAGPILEKAAALDAVGKLDFALFLHAFRPASPARNAEIKKLLDEVVDLSTKADTRGADKPAPYDGSDESLLAIVELASLSGAANTDSAFYAIPCGVLVARPKLVDATKPQYGSNMDNFLPRSGCAWGRGTVSGFPDAEVDAFIAASEEADGNFIANFDGTLKYGLQSAKNAVHEAMKLDPRSFLDAAVPPLAYPYQTWGFSSLVSRAVSLHIKSLYDSAQTKLAVYYARLGLTPEQASKAAKTALFASVFGANCGGAVPQTSLRGLLLDGAAAGEIEAWLASHGVEEAPEVMQCAKFAALDPLPLVAATTPAALPLLLKRGQSANERNAIGKTPLMVAAQFDQMESARLLLATKARVNASTWQQGDSNSLSLSHDARTPLMYAAANASLATMKLLLAAGADPYQSDTKGRRAIDYLLGFGPTPANPGLTPDERVEAQRLLF